MTEEKWKSVEGHPHYKVSNLGRVCSVDRRVLCGPGEGSRHIAGKILKPQMVRTGYFQVDLSGARHILHRLVAAAWCEGFFEGAVVDHLNGDRTDNRACNLEWVTAAENIRRGTASEYCFWQGKNSSEHPKSKAVISTCIYTGKETIWYSGMDAVRAGFRSDSISRACQGKIASHAGNYWRYAEPHPDERASA